MQETSSIYKRLLADPGHWKEYTLVIGESGVLVNEQKQSRSVEPQFLYRLLVLILDFVKMQY